MIIKTEQNTAAVATAAESKRVYKNSSGQAGPGMEKEKLRPYRRQKSSGKSWSG